MSIWQWYVQKKDFNSSMALDIDLEIIWPNEYKSDHHIWIVQLPPWPKETIFMVIYLILCVVRINCQRYDTEKCKAIIVLLLSTGKWFVTWKNIKPRSCPLYPPNPGRNQEGNILNHISRVFCDIYLNYMLKFDLWILCARCSRLKDFMR